MIIAEMCQNHLGKPRLLEMMVRSAAACGARAAKIQTFFAEDLNFDWRPRDHEHIKQCELSWEDHERFVWLCSEHDIIPITSVYSTKYLSELMQSGFRHIKIGSANSHDQTVCKCFADNGFKMIISTGGQQAAYFSAYNGWAALHCVSRYPHRYCEANLNRMIKLRRMLPITTKVGFSDHSDTQEEGTLASKIAILLGADIVERHFTIQPSEKTRDFPVSILPEQLKDICDFEKLSYNGRLNALPEWVGSFASKKRQEEKALIEHYRGRWHHS